MCDQDKETTPDVSKDSLGPPAYGNDQPASSFEQNDAPPKYENLTSTSHITTSAPYRQFPPIINAYFQWPSIKTFNLCGATQEDRLFLIEIHTGYSGSGPLGLKAGLLLHNGMSTKDPILAIAGDESQFAARVYAFNANSIIMLPPLEPCGSHRAMATEMMLPKATNDNDVAFCFSIEVGKKLRREQFKWRKVTKGFELQRLPSSYKRSESGTSGCSNENSYSSTTNNDEIIAILTLTKSWATLKHPVSLELAGSALCGELGDRCTLMVIITALRLWALSTNGRTSKAVLAVGEKIRDK